MIKKYFTPLKTGNSIFSKKVTKNAVIFLSGVT
jgi:hypothetical protein